MYRGYSLTLSTEESHFFIMENSSFTISQNDKNDKSSIHIERTLRKPPDFLREKLLKNVPNLLPTGLSLLEDDRNGQFDLPFRPDVFIAHAEADDAVAQGLADWLTDNFGLHVFIDSWYREHAQAIREEIEFRESCGSIPESHTLEIENIAVSGTLTRIIDSTELFIFLRTPNSIKAMDPTLARASYSGRLYYELLSARLLRRALSDRQKELLKAGREHGYHDLNIKIKNQGSLLLDLEGATLLSIPGLREKNSNKGIHPLDILYQEAERIEEKKEREREALERKNARKNSKLI